MYLKAVEQLNEIARERGWAEATFWVSMAKTANELFAEVDYPDLATLERESKAQDADAESMKVIRSTVNIVIPGLRAQQAVCGRAPQLA